MEARRRMAEKKELLKQKIPEERKILRMGEKETAGQPGERMPEAEEAAGQPEEKMPEAKMTVERPEKRMVVEKAAASQPEKSPLEAETPYLRKKTLDQEAQK